MRRRAWAVLVGAFLTIGAAGLPARAQSGGFDFAPRGDLSLARRSPGYDVAPGYYGTSWGTSSFGYASNFTAFASPSGPGYGFGYGYAPFSSPANSYGARLWKPGYTLPGYVYGSPFYNTFLVPYNPTIYTYPAPIGTYSPGFGPPPPSGW